MVRKQQYVGIIIRPPVGLVLGGRYNCETSYLTTSCEVTRETLLGGGSGRGSWPKNNTGDGSGGAGGGSVEYRAADLQDATCKGNPIAISTGNKVEFETDFVSNEEFGLALSRTYNHYWPGIGLFGTNWISSFDYRLTFGYAAVTGCYPRPGFMGCGIGAETSIFAWRPDGRIVTFEKAADGVFYEDRPGHAGARIENHGDYFLLYGAHGGVERYNSRGRVLHVSNENGIGWAYSYNGTLLQRVTHSSGRYVQFSWSGNKLVSVLDPAGSRYEYTYEEMYDGLYPRLASSSKPGSSPATITYHYENTGRPLALTGKSINGARYSTFTYDSRGYATSSEHNGKDKYTFSYVPGTDGRLTVVETNPLGKKTTYQFKAAGRRRSPATRAPTARATPSP